MKLNLKNKDELKKAIEYFNYLKEKENVIELKKIHKNRSLSQNSYVHLLLGYAAMYYGENLSYFKEYIWKRIIAPDIFKTTYENKVTKEVREDWRSSADLTTNEMTIAVEKLITFCSKEMGLELPEPTQYDKIRHIENEIERNHKYL